MTAWTLYAVSGAAVFAIALHGVCSREGVVRRTIATLTPLPRPIR